MPVIDKPLSWSYSVLDAFDTCPLQLKETRLTKRFSGRNKFNAAGTNDHDAFENRILKGQPLPPHLREHEDALGIITRIPGQARAELELCLTDRWAPTGWFSKDAWARAKIDLSIFDKSRNTVSQFDWKFGRYRKPNRWFQLQVNNLLFDATTKAHGVVVERFNNALVWVSHKLDFEPLIVRQKEMADIRKNVMQKVETYAEAYERDNFPARQNSLCRKFCPVKTCKYHGK